MRDHRSKAFTLAETLIALVILGILLSLYMPTLNKSYEKNTTLANFSDSIGAINKALFNYSMKNKCQGKLNCTDLFFNDTNDVAEKISHQFTPAKVGKNCWNNQRIYNNLDRSGDKIFDTTDLNNLSCFIDGNNRIYATETFNGNCTTNYKEVTYGNKHKLRNSCGLIYVDTNGIKSPNTFGRDVFIFIITDSSPSYLYPVGGTLLQEPVYVTVDASGAKKALHTWLGTCNSDIENEDYAGISKMEGRTCAGRIVEEGMKVNYLK